MLTFKLYDGTYSVTGTDDPTETNIVIPSEYEGIAVTSIYGNAFYNNKAITSMTIPASVTTFYSDCTQGCTNLRTINYLGTIEQWCAINNAIMSDASGPMTLTINGEVVGGDFVIPEGVTRINQFAFRYVKFNSISFPSSLTSILRAAFEYSGLTSINLPEGLTFIGEDAFSGNSLTGELVFPSSLINIGLRAFHGSIRNITSIKFNEGLQSIGPIAFSNNSNVTTITLPSTLTSLGGSPQSFPVFDGFESTVKVYLPDNTTCKISSTNFITSTSSGQIDPNLVLYAVSQESYDYYKSQLSGYNIVLAERIYTPYFYSGAEWCSLTNEKADLSNYYTKPEINATVNTINTNVSTNATNIATLQTDKADKTELQALSSTVEGMYTNEQVDSAITTSITTALEPYSTTTEMNTAISTALQPYSTTEQMNTAISNAVGDITGFEFQVVNSLPSTGEKGIIYLVPHNHSSDDGYDEYIWVDTKFEKIGTTDIDLSQYATKTELADYAKTADVETTYATKTEVSTISTNVATNTANITDLQQTKANQSELADYAKKTDVPDTSTLATKDELAGYLKKSNSSHVTLKWPGYNTTCYMSLYDYGLGVSGGGVTSNEHVGLNTNPARVQGIDAGFEYLTDFPIIYWGGITGSVGRFTLNPAHAGQYGTKLIATVDDITAAIQSQAVEITDVPETATQGTLTADQLTALQSDDSHFIMFNHEKYYLEDKGHTAGYLTYSHVGYENSKHMLKTITVTISTGAWVLNTTEVGGGGGGKTFINPTNSLLGVVVSPNSTTTNTTIAEDLKGAQFMQMYDTENFATITVPANTTIKFPNGGFVSFNPDTGEITLKNQSDSSIAFSYFAVNILIYK